MVAILYFTNMRTNVEIACTLCVDISNYMIQTCLISSIASDKVHTQVKYSVVDGGFSDKGYKSVKTNAAKIITKAMYVI